MKLNQLFLVIKAMLQSRMPRNAAAMVLGAVLFVPAVTRAVISEPDNVLYGNITLDGMLVTAARTDVVIEARRQTNGPAIASYRMGSGSGLGNYYALRLPVESILPIGNTNASKVSDSLFITVTDGSGMRAQTGFTVTERGTVTRVDFGVAAVDSDADGLPDAWELSYFPNLGLNGNSPGANGQSVLSHFISGTDPNDPDGGFQITATLTGGVRKVSFVASQASGVGYEGRQRAFTLESSTNAGNGWVTVAGYSNLIGTNQLVQYLAPSAVPPAFYRARIALEP